MCHPCVPCSIVVVRFCFPARRPRVQIIGGFGVQNIAFAWQRAFADEYRTKSTGKYTPPSGMQFSGWKKVPRCCIPCLCDLAVKIALRPIFRGCRFDATKNKRHTHKIILSALKARCPRGDMLRRVQQTKQQQKNSAHITNVFRDVTP